jgi:hypothetical protein
MLVEGWQIVRELLADRLVDEASRHQKWADVSYSETAPESPKIANSNLPSACDSAEASHVDEQNLIEERSSCDSPNSQ